MSAGKSETVSGFYTGLLVRTVVVIIVIGCLIVAAFSTATRYTLLDVTSGDILTEVRVVGVRLRSEVNETRFSKLVKLNGINRPPELWVRESSKKLMGRHPSPHYRYHGAITALESLMNLFEVYQTSDADKRRLAMEAILILRGGDSILVEVNEHNEISINKD